MDGAIRRAPNGSESPVFASRSPSRPPGRPEHCSPGCLNASAEALPDPGSVESSTCYDEVPPQMQSGARGRPPWKCALTGNTNGPCELAETGPTNDPCQRLPGRPPPWPTRSSLGYARSSNSLPGVFSGELPCEPARWPSSTGGPAGPTGGWWSGKVWRDPAGRPRSLPSPSVDYPVPHPCFWPGPPEPAHAPRAELSRLPRVLARPGPFSTPSVPKGPAFLPVVGSPSLGLRADS